VDYSLIQFGQYGTINVPPAGEDQVWAQIQSFWASAFAPSLKQAFDDCDCE
jgi:hypothetical protein